MSNFKKQIEDKFTMRGEQFRKFIFMLSIAALFSSCSFIEEINRPPDGVFISKNLSSYSIKKIALLPMLPDTKDSNGTYGATNYFLDLLSTEYPKLEYAEIDDIRKFDFSFIPYLLEDIKVNKCINRKAFVNTDLGLMLKDWNCDALLLGNVDSLKRLSPSKYGRYAVCYFTYFLVALKDGKVIWKDSEYGLHFYKRVGMFDTMYLLNEEYVTFKIPINIPICNGIEKLATKLPAKIFNTEK